jgi:hypothetical protein
MTRPRTRPIARNDAKPSPVQAVITRDRAAWIQWLLKDLDHLEAMAAAAQPSESGLTEAQEDLVDHWSPQRVIDDSHAKRALLVAAQTWAEPLNGHVVPLDRLLRTIVTGQAS